MHDQKTQKVILCISKSKTTNLNRVFFLLIYEFTCSGLYLWWGALVGIFFYKYLNKQ